MNATITIAELDLALSTVISLATLWAIWRGVIALEFIADCLRGLLEHKRDKL